MFVFLGSYSGGGGGSSGDDDSQDEESTDNHTQTGVDDFSGNDEGSDDSGTGVGPAAGSGNSTGSGGGGGVIVEPPIGEDAGDGEEAGDGKKGEEEKQPETSDTEEPDIESEDDVGKSNDAEEGTDEEDDDDNDEDDEEDDTVVVVQEVDALSAMSWGVQPVMKRVEECYGEEIELFYKPAPVRELDPKQEKQRWIDAKQVGMPVDPSFWDNDPPDSIELVNKAFEAATQQRRGVDYIREMWREGVGAGRDINDREVLVDLASDLGLDLERFEKDLNGVELKTGERGELPFTFMKIQGKSVPKNGRLRYSDFRTQFTFQGIDEQEPQEVQDFVQEHGPVATPEVIEVYEVTRQEAVQRLEDLDGISSFEVGGERFWSL
ncbi:MAG: DsbA family protein [Euryarchaeota archaeon]|nr:DsbA family protein [Euryarchaeota archaeon]